MCRYPIILILFLFLVSLTNGQKPAIDNSAYADWPSLTVPTLSNDGRYVKYDVVSGSPGYNNSRVIKTVIQSTFNKWKLEFPLGVDNVAMTENSKRVLFLKKGDSLILHGLGTDLVKSVARVSYFELRQHKNKEWLVYKSLDEPKTLILRDLQLDLVRKYKNVDAWKFSEDGSILIIINSNKDLTSQSLSWIEMAEGKVFKVHEHEQYRTENLVINSKHKQIAFRIDSSIWLYSFLNKRATCIVFKDKMDFLSIKKFSKDGQRLFVSFKEIKNPISSNPIVKIWSYLNETLPSETNYENSDNEYLGVINLKSSKFFQLQKKSTDQIVFPYSDFGSDTLALILHRESLNEPWSTSCNYSYSLISTRNGCEQSLDFLNNKKCVGLSPTGKFLIYYDFNINDYLSYEISNGKIRNLTKELKISWLDSDWNDPATNSLYPRGWTKLLWGEYDSSVLVYDQFDIWKLDPLNYFKPINVTNGYGRKNRIVFNLALDDYLINVIGKNESLILNAFDLDNKDNGYFQTTTAIGKDPKLLIMGPYLFDIKQTTSYLPLGSSFDPVKAKYTHKYVVKRMQASEFPNYFLTTDFKKFRTLTDLHPEEKYNWYTTELHSWKSLNGEILQGILYKPANFDAGKKYPVIFQCYQRKSGGLNAYLKPCVLDNWLDINIPTYVSAGYLVFSPDIYYKTGNPMQGSYDAIVSAVHYVAKLPFVNPSKIGIQGGSFGGLQTNYLITHTDLFAAAVSSAGISDLVSGYGTLLDGKWSQQSLYEEGQLRMGGSLWEKADAYITNSPIFGVHQVTTPLLIMHGTKDQACPFTNAMEFFIGLRRMGKRVWMLVYPNAGHGVAGEQGNDFSIRMMQFFDHYLKEKPVPIWMSKGQDLTDESPFKSYQYDTVFNILGNGLLTSKEQAKVDSLMIREPITISLY